MNDQAHHPFDTADDGFESYYAEKLWSWIPEFYQTLDLDPPNPGVLRALIEVVASQAAVLRRDIDRVWDDQAIELCDAWAISYLGDLVGAFDVSEFNDRGQRSAVAKAIYYQRRKGTMTVMHDLIRDIAGVEGVVVEAFRRLVRFPHRLDVDSIGQGRITQTPIGGLIDLRTPRVKGIQDTGFDEGAHFPDTRRLRGSNGRYGIRKVNFHLYALRSYPVALPTPVQIGPSRFTLDPSGRDVALFQRGQPREGGVLDQPCETDMPDAMSCRRFNASRHRITFDALAAINDPGLDVALAPLLGVDFRGAASFRRVLEMRLSPAQMTVFTAALLDATLLPDSEKAILWPDSLSLSIGDDSDAEPLAPSAVIAADLDNWEQNLPLEPYRAVAFDPQTGRVVQGPAVPDGELFADMLHYGQFAPLGAGTYGRAGGLAAQVDTVFDGGTLGGLGGFVDAGPQAIDLTGALPTTDPQVLRFLTSKTYEPVLPELGVYDILHDTTIEGADGTRPYLVFRPEIDTLDITFRAGTGAPNLLIDGLWIGMLAHDIIPENTNGPATPITARLILEGDFSTVTIRNATLDPGGERARDLPNQAVAIPIVRLELEGQITKLEIQRCITGPIHETSADSDLCNAGRIEICDSVIQANDPGDPALRTRLGEFHLTRTTVFGDVQVARLYASETVIDGRVTVTDSQNGCFRYSATGGYLGTAVLPRQFESVVVENALPFHWIASRRFGDAWFAALSQTAPMSIARGGSNGAEMGVFNGRGLAVLLDDLASAVTRMMPVGQTPQYILEREDTP
ncbi:MAG: hypothetical protein ABJG75_17390 [Roseobacter sp.]